jgi:hypothetical protein
MRRTALVITFLLLCTRPSYSYDLGFLELHGFGSVGFMDSSANNYLIDSDGGSFQFNEFGLSGSTSLRDDLRIGLQLLSRDLGTVGNNEVKINWGLVDYQWRNELGVKLGIIKSPLGLYNETRDYDMLRTSILLPQSVYDENFRESQQNYTGGGLYGNISMGKAGSLRYDLVLGTVEMEPDGGIAKSLSSNESQIYSANADLVFGGRVEWHLPLRGLKLVTTYFQLDLTYAARSTTAPVTNRIELPELRHSIFSLEYNHGNFTAAAEYIMSKADVTVNTDLSKIRRPNPPAMEYDRDAEGYYGRISYRFTDWFEAGTYYSVYYPNKKDRGGNDEVAQGNPDHRAWQKDFAVSTRFDITDWWLIKLEMHYMDGTALCTEMDNPDGFEKTWTLFAIKSTFSF